MGTQDVEGGNYDIRNDKFEAMMEAKTKIVQMGIDGRAKEAEKAAAAAKEAKSQGGENVV